MGTEKSERDTGIKRQVKSSWQCSCTRSLLVRCSFLILFAVSFSNTFFISNYGVLYYLGNSTPTTADMIVIKDWERLPVLFLVYDGPYEYKEVVENILKKRGYLLGYGKDLIVKIRTRRNVFVYQIIYENVEKDNFLSPSPLEKMEKILDKAISEILPEVELPEKLFLVYYDPDSNSFIKKIERTENILKEGLAPSPVIIKTLGNRFYKVKIGDVEKTLKEGFYVMAGKLIYVGKNLELKNLVNFFPNTEGVFFKDNDMIFYQKDFLIFPDGNVLKIEKPVDVARDNIILPTGILKNGDFKNVEGTILWVKDNFILTSRGELRDLALTWIFKISSVPKEWCFRGNFLYILDICGFLRKYDLKQRKLIWEKKIEGAWGIDVSDEVIAVGTKNGILLLNNRDGNMIKEVDGEDFGYWENEGIFLIYKDGMINEEYFGKGYFLRYEGIPIFVREDGSVVVFGNKKYEFRKVREIIGFSWGVEIVTEEGTWLIGKRK